MPSKKAPCTCPSCNGALRDAKTVKKHLANQVAAQTSKSSYAAQWQDLYTRAKQRREDEDTESLADSDEGGHGLEGAQSRLGGNTAADLEGLQRPVKRRRINEGDSTPEGNMVNYNDNGMNELNLQDGDDTDSDDNRQTSLKEPEDLPLRRNGSHPLAIPDSEDEDELPQDLHDPNTEDEEEELRIRTEAMNLLHHDEPQAGAAGPGMNNPTTKNEDFHSHSPISRIEHVRIAQAFIDEIKNATLDNGKLDPAATERLRNPDTNIIDLTDPDLRFSLELYMNCINASEATYEGVRESTLRRFPQTKILSHYLAKKLVSDISGVVSVADDMCINSCHAFTGPFADLDACSICFEPRYTTISSARTQKKVPRQKVCTIPLGPQIQALRRSIHGANAMCYRYTKTAEILAALDGLENELDTVYDDIFCGRDVLEMTANLELTSNDTTVIFSLDGAQLYQNKKSDTWIAIWIITDYDPKTRYRSKHVLPAVIVPGPNKPKNIDSFLFRTFHHLSAIQREDNGAGIRVFDAIKNSVVSSRTCLLCATADAPGLTEIDGRVGHHGAQGCRKGCEMKGRHKPSSGHYFAAHLKPNNFTVDDCNHPDFDFHNFTFQPSPETYRTNIMKIINSTDQNDYEKNRKLTGISKPSILSGLHQSYMLQVPLCFTVDLMHLFCLNIGELLIPIWRGTFKCESTDDKSSWDWATLTGETWQTHGKLVAAATQFFPASFHRPPRNPAEKISSGYKATEYYLYLFGLGPAFFRTFLPKKYWKNFCKLVHGVHIIMQRRMTGRQVQESHRYFVQFVEEYENIYYQRRADHLHFNRPCLHAVLHTSPEVLRVGNGCHTDQFTIERAIGDLGKGIRQPSNPYGNLCHLALRRSQINAMKTICPELDKDLVQHLPQYSVDLGTGYVVLRPRQKVVQEFTQAELKVVQTVCDKTKRQKWGHLQLPNGQIARSLYSENKRIGSENISKRVSRNVKVNFDGKTQFGEVQFYFFDKDDDEQGDKMAYAIISLYGPPNEEMLNESSHTLWASEYEGQSNLCCLPVAAIISVISMQPLPRRPEDPENLWFVVEKSGLDDVELSGYEGLGES